MRQGKSHLYYIFASQPSHDQKNQLMLFFSHFGCISSVADFFGFSLSSYSTMVHFTRAHKEGKCFDWLTSNCKMHECFITKYLLSASHRCAPSCHPLLTSEIQTRLAGVAFSWYWSLTSRMISGRALRPGCLYCLSPTSNLYY